MTNVNLTPPKPTARKPINSYFTPLVGMVATGVAVVLLIGTVSFGAAYGNESGARAHDTDTHYAQVSSLQTDLDHANAELDTAREKWKPAYAAQESLATQQALLKTDQARLKTDQEQLKKDQAALKKGQDQLAADHDKLEAARDAVGTEFWIKEVRQCLARGGSYVSADVTDSSYGGIDVSCYNG